MTIYFYNTFSLIDKMFFSIPITTNNIWTLKKTVALSNILLPDRIKFALKTIVQYHTNKSVKKPNNLNLGIRSTIIKIAHLSWLVKCFVTKYLNKYNYNNIKIIHKNTAKIPNNNIKRWISIRITTIRVSIVYTLQFLTGIVELMWR